MFLTDEGNRDPGDIVRIANEPLRTRESMGDLVDQDNIPLETQVEKLKVFSKDHLVTGTPANPTRGPIIAAGRPVIQGRHRKQWKRY